MADSGSASSLSKDAGLQRFTRTAAGAFQLIEGESTCDAKGDEEPVNKKSRIRYVAFNPEDPVIRFRVSHQASA